MVSFKEFNLLYEASYAGNIGVMEVIKFRKMASPDELNTFYSHIQNKRHKDAWELVQRVTNNKLHSSAFSQGAIAK